MSIASEIATLAANKAAIKAAIVAKNPSTMPTNALSQWPTAIASISGSSPASYDAEVDYVTFPAGSYVDPEIEDFGSIMQYDFGVTFRLPSDASNYDFRFGNWRGQQTNSFMFWPYEISGNTMKVLVCWNQSTPGVGTLTAGTFWHIETSLGNLNYNGTTIAMSLPGTALQAQRKFIICGLDNNGSISGSSIDIDVSECSFTSSLCKREFIPVRVGQTGYLYDKMLKKLYGSNNPTIALIPGPDKA